MAEAYGCKGISAVYPFDLDEKIQEMGAENVIAFIAAPIVGATGGVLVPVPVTLSVSARSVTAMVFC